MRERERMGGRGEEEGAGEEVEERSLGLKFCLKRGSRMFYVRMCICHCLHGYCHVQVVKRYNKYEKERQELIKGVHRGVVYCMLCVIGDVCVIRVCNTHTYYVCTYIRMYVPILNITL